MNLERGTKVNNAFVPRSLFNEKPSGNNFNLANAWLQILLPQLDGLQQYYQNQLLSLPF